MSWFNVLLSVRQRLNDNDDYNKMCQVTDELDASSDIEARKNTMSKYFALYHILSNTKVAYNKKCWELMMLSLDESYQQKVSEAVEQLYNDISQITLDETNIPAYSDILSRIIKSNGLFLNEKNRTIEEVEPVELKVTKDFIDSFNTLKNSPHTVRNICSFMYKNKFQSVDLSKITNEQHSENFDSVFDDIKILPYIVKAVSDVKSHSNIFKNNIYKAMIADYTSDSDFVEVLNKVNPNNKYFLNCSVTCTYNSLKANKIIESINAIYTTDNIIGIGIMTQQLKSQNWTMSKFRNLANIFKSKKLDYSLNNVLTELNKFIETHQSTNQVIDDDNFDKIEEYADNAIVTLLNGYFTTIQNINLTISRCNNKLIDGFYINGIKLSLKEVIQKWKSFISADVYKWSGEGIDEDCSKKADELIKNSKKKYEPKIDTNGNVKIFNKDIVNIIQVIKDIDLKNNSNMFISIIQFLTPQYAKDDAPVMAKVIICQTILEYLKDFFSIPFNDKGSTPMAKVTGRYYDAACCVIYKNDAAIKESLDNMGDESFIMFESYIINEDTDYRDYFKKVSDHMKEVMKTDKPDVVLYVDKYAKYIKDDTTDSSTSEETTSPTTQINTMTTDAALQTISTVDDFSGEIDMDALSAAIS